MTSSSDIHRHVLPAEVGAGGYPLLGVYPQRQDGLFMQRIKVFGGRIDWDQWRLVSELAGRHTPGSPIHITTRQDIELHNIRHDDLQNVHRALAGVNLRVYGSGGDSVRNITVCTGCHYNANAAAAFSLAQLVDSHLSGRADLLELPRKFKISFSSCAMACSKPWISDLGFILKKDGTCDVVGAGSLGARPALGIQLYKSLPARDVLPLCIAAIEFFRDHGDREHRHRARFRHVREKLGDDAFRKELERRFYRAKGARQWPEPDKTAENVNLKLLWKLQLPGGNIDSNDAIILAEVAEHHGAELRINIEHGIELYGDTLVELPGNLASLEDNAIIIACPGSAMCRKGLVNTQETADMLRNHLGGRLNRPVRICISGCPNGCAHSAVADVGLTGVIRTQNSRRTEEYCLLTGGGNGSDNRLSQQQCTIPKDDTCARIERFLKESGFSTAQSPLTRLP